jgi:hypothetical protein
MNGARPVETVVRIGRAVGDAKTDLLLRFNNRDVQRSCRMIRQVQRSNSSGETASDDDDVGRHRRGSIGARRRLRVGKQDIELLGGDCSKRYRMTPIRRSTWLGSWLFWRAGPATKANSRYVAIHEADLTRIHTFRLFPDGTGSGDGPAGTEHQRFRTWKEELNETP